MKRPSFLLLPVCSLVGVGALAQTATHALPTFTAEQAARGETLYREQCEGCHGDKLDNGEFGVPLRGPVFAAHWHGKGLDAPFQVMIEQMPPTNPGGLGVDAYVDLLAFLLSQNGIAPSQTPLPADPAALGKLAAPG
jgi:mono/diheme cytochrome c family protein